MTATAEEIHLAIVWDCGPFSGKISALNGRIRAARLAQGQGAASHDSVRVMSEGPARLELTLSDARLGPGANPTMVQLEVEKSPLTFLARDVTSTRPIYIPEYGVAVTDASDTRTFFEIAEAVRRRGALSGLQRWANEPEETFEQAAARTRDMKCPTWLGVARDVRMFRVMQNELAGSWGRIVSAYPASDSRFDMTDDNTYFLNFVIGPGPSCRVQLTRRLEEGVLPILRSVQQEGDVVYHVTAFATLETRPLSAAAVRGSDWRAAYEKTYGNMYTAEERQRLKELIVAETTGREEEVVCCLRAEAVNTGQAPRYAWFKAALITPGKSCPYDGRQGFCALEPERVYAVHRLDGRPMPQEEMAVLLQPGERVVFDILVPHQPLSSARAAKLGTLNLDEHLAACRNYWREKLAAGAQIRVPERAIDERLRAGLLHLDINSPGLEPDGNVLACTGAYPPIGTESAPIIMFFDSMGWHRLAERVINFFLDRQREDGFMQNFGGYESETGPVLWAAGEHFRYTRDEAWVRRVKPQLLKSCDYLLKWRAANQTEEMRAKGCFGLLAGKVADPEDRFHSFMLNGLSYIGLQRVAEMLETIDPAEAVRLAQAASEFKKEIRQAYYAALARSPVVPLGDGKWAPAPPPWPEYRGPVGLYAEGGKNFYGAFCVNDSLIGPLYLVIGEVLEHGELGAAFMLKAHQELMTVENVGFGQPYYCRHDFLHLKRGEVKEYLKTYYNQLTSLQDRETYTFWECYTHASQHKTHEEGWFLMQTRWLLFLEEGGTLAFLRAIPRRWLEHGKKIELRNVATYFGPASLRVESKLNDGSIEAAVECKAERRPREITIRLPHPEGRKAVSVVGGAYNPAGETVRIAPFSGSAKVVLRF